MIRKYKILFIPLLFLISNVCAQDYFRYQRIINAIDDDILSNNLNSALVRADTIFEDYDFIYARHCIKALQISCELKDSIKAEKWLQKSFLQGVPKWMIYANEITLKATRYSNTQSVLVNYDALHKQYLGKINRSLRKTVDSLRVLDKKFTDRVNLDNNIFKLVTYNLQWRKNSRKQVKVLIPLIEKYGFPGERLIGFEDNIGDSAKCISNAKYYGIARDLSGGGSEVMFIHYFSIPRKSLNSILFPNVKSGFLTQSDYGSFNDFLAKWGKKKYRNYYYNIWHSDSNKNNLADIEKRRAAIGLETLDRQKQKSKISYDRRGKDINSKIILEINH